MRVCLIGATHPCHNPRLVREADSLAEVGHDVRVVTPCMSSGLAEKDGRLLAQRKWRLAAADFRRNSWSGKLRSARIRVRRSFARTICEHLNVECADELAYSLGFPEMVSLACREPADWFIAHSQPALPIAVRASQRWNGHLGFDCEDLLAESGSDPVAIVRRIEGSYLQKCDYVAAPSRVIAKQLARDYGIPVPIVLYNVFPLSLATEILPPNERRGSRVLKLHWFSQVIGPGRGIEDAVEAVGLIGNHVELHLRGSLYEPYRTAIHSFAQRHGVMERVFYHPQIDHDALIKSIAEFDVGLALERPQNGNYSKTVTNKVFSYVLAGLAVAATDTPGQREALEQMPSAGFLFPAGNAAALAEGISRWLDDRDSLKHAQQAAWDVARRRFCWDRENEQFLTTLERMHKDCVASVGATAS